MVDQALDAVDSRGRLVIDGPFAANTVFVGALAALRPERPVLLSDLRDGTTAGAALIAAFERPEDFPRRPLALRDAVPAALPDFAGWRDAWRAAAFAEADARDR
jgi:sugar (pentulose or hexulose) kinase